MSDTKEKIKKIAINLFYKRGYFATGINDIARRAGIQKSSIYYHYANKEEILFDILKTTMQDLQSNFVRSVHEASDAEAQLAAAIRSHIIFHLSRQKEAIISDSELRGLTVRNYKTILAMRDDYEYRFQEVLRKGIAERVFAEMDYKVISYGIITMCTAVAFWFRKTGRLSKEEIAEVYAGFILNGLK